MVLVLLLQSCKKDDGFGLDIVSLPGDRFTMGFTDTISVLAMSRFEDSLQTSGVFLSLLGSFHDPVFGRTTAGLYTQALLPTSNVDFGLNPIGDSLILTLRFNGYYGNPRTHHRVKIYEIDPTTTFHKDSAYFSNQNLPAGDLLFDGLVRFNAVDSTTFNGVKVPPIVKIPLNNVLIQKFINASNTPDLLNNTNFREFFKGLYITVEEATARNQGSIGYFNLNADLSAMTLYYRNDTDTLTYTFLINDECARFSHFDHAGHQHAEPGLLQQDTTGNNPRLYLQPMAGVKIHLTMPYLQSLIADGPRGITRAELVLKADQSDFTASAFAPPPRLTIARVNEEGKSVFITDFLEGEVFMGGNYDPVKKEYRFRITRHLQEILSGKYPDTGLVVMVSGAAVTASRVTILGNTPVEQNLRLEVVFATP
jgi:hypothetical protein